MTARSVFLNLVQEASLNFITGCPDAMVLEHARRQNQAIPDKCLPGRMIMRLTADERKHLQELTAEMTFDCLPLVQYL